jgi:hypothetical protein
MNKQIVLFVAFFTAIGAWAEGNPNLVIRDESYKHSWDRGTKIWHSEISANESGIIDQIVYFFETEPDKKIVVEFKRAGNRITWTDEQPDFDRTEGELIISGKGFTVRTAWTNLQGEGETRRRQNRVRIGEKGNMLWEDDEKTVFLDPDGTYREIAKKPDSSYKFAPSYFVIVSNEMIEWLNGNINYRVVFSREGDRTMTQHLQGRDDGEWDELGWGSIEGPGLRSADPMVTAINAYILKQFFYLPVYLPHLLGLKTGTL